MKLVDADKVTIEIDLSLRDRLTGKTKLYLDEDEIKTMLFFLGVHKQAFKTKEENKNVWGIGEHGKFRESYGMEAMQQR